jgi:hypothetical protein
MYMIQTKKVLKQMRLLFEMFEIKTKIQKFWLALHFIAIINELNRLFHTSVVNYVIMTFK